LNESIDIVERIQWICSANLALLLVPTVVFTASFCRFCMEEWPFGWRPNGFQAANKTIKNIADGVI
jgi:hypothetical protein